MRTVRHDAIRFVAEVLRHASDSQCGQTALFDHDKFGPWIAKSVDPVDLAADIVHHAEMALGFDLPY